MKRERESGSLLIEVMIAIALLAIGILGFCTSFMSNARTSSELEDQDEVRVAFENVVEVLRSSPFDQIYANFQGAVLEVPTLEGWSGSVSSTGTTTTSGGGTTTYIQYYGGGTATASVSFYVNELMLPPQFGPILDIDGVPGLTTVDCSTTYKLLPTQITLNYGTRSGPVSKTIYVVLGET